MADKKRYLVHVAETRHFEFEVWAADSNAAEEMASQIWTKAATTGQWELPDTDTEYTVAERMTEAELLKALEPLTDTATVTPRQRADGDDNG